MNPISQFVQQSPLAAPKIPWNANERFTKHNNNAVGKDNQFQSRDYFDPHAHLDLRSECSDTARWTDTRLMKDIKTEDVIPGKNHRTNAPDNALPCPSDWVNRQYQAPAPKVPWVSDFTYVATSKVSCQCAGSKRVGTIHRSLNKCMALQSDKRSLTE